MRWWHRTRELVRTLFRSSRVHRELDDELEDWVTTLAARHRARGIDAQEARRLAMLEFGGMARVREEAVAVRNGAEVESTMLDVRYALRAMRRTPAFTAAAMFTFALGIGASAAIFSVVKAVIIEPLPYHDADRLVGIWAELTDLGYPHAPLSGPEVAEFQTRATSFERIGGVWATNGTLGGTADPEQLRLATVTPDFFTVLGVPAAHGRFITIEDFGQTITPVLLSHALWVSSFGADPAAIGRRVTINDQAASIVGVMPVDFELLFPPDAAVPRNLQAWVPGSARLATQPRGQQYLRVVGRVRDDVPLDAAIQEIATIGASIHAANPGAYTPGSRFYAVGMKDETVRTVRPAVLAMFGGVLLLLVIACVNVAGLLIVRASDRRREIAMRLALGASRSRLFRQCLVEGLLLAAGGALVGLAIAYPAVTALTSLAPDTAPRVQAAELDLTALAVTASAAVIWGVSFSLLPWIEVRRVTALSTLHRIGRAATASHAARLRAALMVAQVAFSFVLLVGAALMARTFWSLTQIDPGFKPEQTLSFRIAPPFQRYRASGAMNALHRGLLDRLQATPGVVSAGSISHLPYDKLPNWATPYLPLDEPDTATSGLADTRTVSPGFFEAAGARLVAGRAFTEQDAPIAGAMPVIVDELLAARLFGSASPLGRRFKSDLGGTGRMAPMEVIGVVSHLRHRSLVDPGREQLFVPARLWLRNPASYVVRTSGDPLAVVGAIREAVHALDPALPVYDVAPLEQYVTSARAPSRFTLILALTFAGVALVLACVGVYGVVAYGVGRRAHEFGIRRALGAESSSIVGLAMRDVWTFGALGLATGVLAAVALTRLMSSLLYAVTPADPIAFTVAIATLVVSLLLASWLPARRAATVPPLDVLKSDG